jgi:plastocyanin
VTISAYTFSPDPLVVPAGATVTVTNTDTVEHTAISEAAANDFTNAAAPGGWTFGVILNPGETQSFVVPTTIASGTVQPYYCSVHKSMMANPNPTLQIQ